MSDPALVAVLEDARAAGFLGPGDVAGHIEHARGFAHALPSGGIRVVDLGSGGGVPGLILALDRPDTAWTLLDSIQRRAHFLDHAIGRLGLADRVEVYAGRAEAAGRDPEHRAGYGAAVARSFGPPAVTAEAAAPLLRQGGVLVVSEPPTAPAGRWPAEMTELGLAVGEALEVGGAHYQVLVQVQPCPGRYPRREGMAAKRPLFDVSRETLD